MAARCRFPRAWTASPILARFTANVQMRNLDVAKVLDVTPSARGKMGGTGELDLQLLGNLSDAWKKTLSGTGKFAVRNGHLPGVNLAGAAESVAKMAGVGGNTPFTVLEGDITIADQRVSSKQIHLDSSAGIVDLRGSVGLDGTLDYQGTATVNPAAALGSGSGGQRRGRPDRQPRRKNYRAVRARRNDREPESAAGQRHPEFRSAIHRLRVPRRLPRHPASAHAAKRVTPLKNLFKKKN